jgi:hypothetical protein
MKMTVRLFLFLQSITLLSCAGSALQSKSTSSVVLRNDIDFWDITSNDDGLVFFGVAGGNYLSRDRAITLALEDVARRIAFYHSVGGKMVHNEKQGPGFLDFGSDHKAILSYDQDYKKYVRELEFDSNGDIHEENHLLFVRSRYKVKNPVAINHVRTSETGEPWWIVSPPATIDGNIAGVGFAAKRFYRSDTVISSYENAVFGLLKTGSVTVNSKREIAQHFTDTSLSITVSGELKNFYIVEVWTDPKTLDVWTLAIAREIITESLP